MVIMKIFINTWQLFLIWRCRIIYSNFSHLSYADGTVKWSRIHKLANFTMERNLQDTVTVILHQRLLYEVAIICRSRSLQRAMTKKKSEELRWRIKKIMKETPIADAQLQFNFISLCVGLRTFSQLWLSRRIRSHDCRRVVIAAPIPLIYWKTDQSIMFCFKLLAIVIRRSAKSNQVVFGR